MDIKFRFGRSSGFDYNKDAYADAVMYFISSSLIQYTKKKLNVEVIVDVKSVIDRYIDRNCEACMSVSPESILMIIISTHIIEEDCDAGCYYDDRIKSLLHCTLHEISHMRDLLDEYYGMKSQERNKLSLYLMNYNEVTKVEKVLERAKNKYDEYELRFMNPEESLANLFAFQNLQFLENLYYYKAKLHPISLEHKTVFNKLGMKTVQLFKRIVGMKGV